MNIIKLICYHLNNMLLTIISCHYFEIILFTFSVGFGSIPKDNILMIFPSSPPEAFPHESLLSAWTPPPRSRWSSMYTHCPSSQGKTPRQLELLRNGKLQIQTSVFQKVLW